MNLADFLREENMTNVEFAKRVGASNVTVCRWKMEKHLPTRKFLSAIKIVTDGKVTANDFYE